MDTSYWLLFHRHYTMQSDNFDFLRYTPCRSTNLIIAMPKGCNCSVILVPYSHVLRCRVNFNSIPESISLLLKASLEYSFSMYAFLSINTCLNSTPCLWMTQGILWYQRSWLNSQCYLLSVHDLLHLVTDVEYMLW